MRRTTESLARVQDVLAAAPRAVRCLDAQPAVQRVGQKGPVQVIHTDDAPSHAGPVPQAVEAGGWIYVSALFGADPRERAIPEDPRAEAEQLFDNLAAILAAAGSGLTDVVRVGIVMRDLQRDRPVFNEVWAERFGNTARPGRRSSPPPSAAPARTPAFHGDRRRGLPRLTPSAARIPVKRRGTPSAARRRGRLSACREAARGTAT